MPADNKRIAVIPGDGIGPEVIGQAMRVLERVKETHGIELELVHFDWGADKYLNEGISLPPGALEMLSSEFNAILAGAFGDPRVTSNKHAEDILLGMRRGLDLYINLRPVRLLDARLTPLRNARVEDIDFVVFRENTEGAYCGAGGFLRKGTSEEIATQEELNTRRGVERIIVAAFEYARANGRKRVTMADKSNVQRFGGDLWQRVFKEVAADYSELEANHQYVDAMAMFMVLNPAQYDVIVSNNLFGDILTDLGAAIQGGLGLAASGNIHPGRVSLFEPVHGSAPPLAGKGKANPVGAILTSAMMLEYLGHKKASEAIGKAVSEAISHDETTPDLGGVLSTEQVGTAILQRINGD
ncbi:MAG TPA: 3-isopropylmalate dehydrogenase [Blastocatellia bacterium]|jgi:3-isopropylmalate dehydrogenase|nr:3-isopropylmalate dehydrogenase [Blastocatellia bacterium]HAF25648.1 3-isopropylmalate dehydrogenase [Blastocatellia bacterium]